MTASARTAAAAVAERWGETPPAWVTALAAACDRAGKRAVARRLGYSLATVRQALNRSYPGHNYSRIEAAVRAAYMPELVTCPTLGEIPAQACGDHQDAVRRGAFSSPIRQRLRRACPGCPRWRYAPAPVTGGTDAQ